MTLWSRGFAALAVTGVLASGVALARGPNMNLPIFGSVTPGDYSPNYQSAPPFRNFFTAPEESGARAHYEDQPERRKAKTRAGSSSD